MKIVQITPFFIPNSGGVEEYVLQISEFLADRKFEVDVLTTNILRGQNRRLKNIERYNNVTIFRFTLSFH